MPRKSSPKTPDKDVARELCLYIENDGTLYRQMYRPIVLNFAKKVVKRSFNRTLAIKGVVNLVNVGIAKYRKEFGLPAVSQATKESCARQLLSGMVEEVRIETKKLILAKASKKGRK